MMSDVEVEKQLEIEFEECKKSIQDIVEKYISKPKDGILNNECLHEILPHYARGCDIYFRLNRQNILDELLGNFSSFCEIKDIPEPRLKMGEPIKFVEDFINNRSSVKFLDLESIEREDK